MALGIPPEGEVQLALGASETPQEVNIVNFNQFVTAIRAASALEQGKKIPALLAALKRTSPQAYAPTLIADYIVAHVTEAGYGQRTDHSI